MLHIQILAILSFSQLHIHSATRALIDGLLQVAHLLLHAVGQGRVIETQAELDVALLGAVGEVGAAYQQEAVVDAEELGVARHGAPVVLRGAGAHDDGAA